MWLLFEFYLSTDIDNIKHCIQLLAKKMEVSIFHLQKNCCLEIMVSSVSMTEVQVKILSGQLFMI